jgi:hypothetical protein
MRIIQPGQGLRRNVLLGTYTQASIHEMAVALGPATTVLQIDQLPEGHAPMTRAQLLEKVRTLGADEIGELALIGWSAGCHGVRDHLVSLSPEIVIPLDGTHGSIPQPGSMPLAPWRDAVARARRGELLLVVSHTYLTYTDHLPAGQAFMSTAHVMRELTGWALPEPTDPKVPAVKRDSGLVVYSWQSGDVDGAAHVRQVTHAGPLLVADWLAPRWLGDAAPPVSAETLAGLAASASEAPPDTEPQPSTRRTTDAPAGEQSAELDSPNFVPPELTDFARRGYERRRLALDHLARALGELGVHETPGPASTARIDEYLAVALRGGKPLGLHGDDQFSWCACFASWCGLPPGMTPRAAVVELVEDAKGLGLYRDNATWHDPQPGDLAIYATGGVPHHVNRVELRPQGGTFGAVGGNEANAVRRSTRQITEPVGWIVYPR